MAGRADSRILVLTPGDPAGIGPEITWKAIQSGIEEELGVRILCVGAEEPFRKLEVPVERVTESNLREVLERSSPAGGRITLLPAPENAPLRTRSRHFSLPGFQSGWSIEKAVRLVQASSCRALVTGPISKERFQAGGFPFPGHTEFLAHLCRPQSSRRTGKRPRPPEVVMMLANERLRVTLVTTHVPLAKVPRVLKTKDVERTILTTVDHLRKWWKIECPRVAVTALNPHAGEGGLFGNEERKIITPTVKSLMARSKGRYTLSGPHPADTIFAKHISSPENSRDDAVVCMYHDQGLIPVKLIDFGGTVNVTLGLPIVRTSVDHGTGFDIAGKGIADPSSMLAAIRLAARISNAL